MPVQKIRFTEDSDGIFEYKLQKRRTGHFTKKIRETWSTDHRHESGRPKHARTEKKVTTVDELSSLLSQEGQAHTSFNTPDIQRDGSNTV